MFLTYLLPSDVAWNMSRQKKNSNVSVEVPLLDMDLLSLCRGRAGMLGEGDADLLLAAFSSSKAAV